MTIGYTTIGDYLLPNIAYCDETLHFGCYSRLRQKFLKENHVGVYNEMLLSGSLWEHLAEIEASCQARLERIVSTLAKSEGVTEAMKETNQLEWVRIRSRSKKSFWQSLFTHFNKYLPAVSRGWFYFWEAQMTSPTPRGRTAPPAPAEPRPAKGRARRLRRRARVREPGLRPRTPPISGRFA